LLLDSVGEGLDGSVGEAELEAFELDWSGDASTVVAWDAE